MIKLYILTSRDNVKKRWIDISQGKTPKSIETNDLSGIDFSSECCLLIHLDSLSKDQITLLCTYWNKVNLIGFSDNPNDTQGIELLLRGFKGYINTFVTHTIFNQLLESVLGGDIWAGTSIVQKMLKRLLQQSKNNKSAPVDTSEFGLSEREQETVDILITGASNKEIARKLDITERTVKAHVSAILRKTETFDRVSLIIKLKDGN
jgi:DNA-binding NarL/FixJ family response regulator